MKKRYRSWHLPVLSFYSKLFYRDVAVRWKGTNLGILFLVLAICVIPTARNAGQFAGRFLDRQADIFLMQIPPMQIQDGKLAVNAPQPYSIIEGNRTVLLIDTTGRVNSLEEADALAFMNSTHLYITQPNNAPQVIPLEDLGDLELSQDIALQIIEGAREAFLPVYYVVIYLASVLAFFFLTLLLGSVAILFAALQKRKLNYPGGLRISVVALTPMLILSGLVQLAERSVHPLLYLLLALAYLYMATGCARKLKPDELYLDNEPIGH